MPIQVETVPKVTKKNSTSSSDSDSNSQPVVKKKRATRRFRHTAPAQSSEPSEDISAKASIYSHRVDDCFSAFHYGNALSNDTVKNQLVDLSDDDDTEKQEVISAITKKANTTPKREKRRMKMRSSPLDKTDGDYIIIDSQESPERTLPSQPTCSPSPPPRPPTYYPNVKKKRPTKAIKTALANLNRAKSQLANTSLVTCGDDSFLFAATPERDPDIVVKVRSRSGVHRFPMKKRDIFSTVITQLADIENVPEAHCILYLKDTTIEPFQTLSSSGITIADILQCCVQGEVPDVALENDSFDEDDDQITVRVQSADKKITSLIRIKKNEALQKVMHYFAQERKLDLKKLRFEFDGETLKGSETPEDLEMEDGDCVDAIFL
ncbi:NFATC2-interacting protein-like isoform X2 [Lineus longissimus]